MRFAYLLLFFGSIAQAKVETDARGIPLAAPEATVDRVAYSYQQTAISRLESMLNAKRQTAQEPALLDRLTRLQWENAEITFRIAHAVAYERKKPLELTLYRQVLNRCLSTATRLIQNYPQSQYVPQALVVRAKAWTELGRKDKAVADYTTVVSKYPAVDLAGSAYLALGEFAFEGGQYAKSIPFFERVLKQKDHQQFSYALRRLSWAHYHLNSVPAAIRYLRAYLVDQMKSGAGAGVNEDLFEEVATFYFKGIELASGQYSVDQALAVFREIATSAGTPDGVPVAATQLAKLMRARARNADLERWKVIVLRELRETEAPLRVLTLVMEHYLNMFRYKDLVDTAQELVTLKNPASKNALLAIAGKLQETLKVNRGDEGRMRQISGTLAGIYTAYLTLNPEVTPESIQIRFNLAESQAFVGKYGLAYQNYFWVLQRAQQPASKQALQKSGLSVKELSFKTIATLYEDLKLKGQFPTQVAAVAMDHAKASTLDERFDLWASWVRGFRTQFQFNDPRIAFYRYEMLRALYSHGQVAEAIDELEAFVRQESGSQYAVPAAELVLDSLVLSEQWARVQKVAQDFRALNLKGNENFRQHISKVISDSTYKLAETDYNDGKFQNILANSETFNKVLQASPERRVDWLMVMAKAASASQQDAKAMEGLNEVLRDGSQAAHKYRSDAFLLRATIMERNIELSSALDDYLAHFRSGQIKSRDVLAQKIYLYAWLLGRREQLRTLTNENPLCQAAMESCLRSKVLVLANSPKLSREEFLQVQKRAQEGPLWALMSLESDVKASAERRLQLLQVIQSNYSKLDPLIQLSFLERVSNSISRTFSLSRSEVARHFPVKADPASIQRRLASVKQLENASTGILDFPFTRTRVEILTEVGGLYSDLATDIERIPAPNGLKGADLDGFRATLKELAAPYRESALTIQTRALELASTQGVEDPLYQVVFKRAAALSPEAKPASFDRRELSNASNLGPELLTRLEQVGADAQSSKTPRGKIAKRWSDALKLRNFALAAYYAKLAEEGGHFHVDQLALMRAALLVHAGAQAEGLEELSKIQNRRIAGEKSKGETDAPLE